MMSLQKYEVPTAASLNALVEEWVEALDMEALVELLTASSEFEIKDAPPLSENTVRGMLVRAARKRVP